jgi:hypothetical protein
LIRDFQGFSDQSPAAYFKDEPDLARHFTGGSRVSDFYNTEKQASDMLNFEMSDVASERSKLTK